jgi:hypothetical protein
METRVESAFSNPSPVEVKSNKRCATAYTGTNRMFYKNVTSLRLKQETEVLKMNVLHRHGIASETHSQMNYIRVGKQSTNKNSRRHKPSPQLSPYQMSV